jgi:TrmH family RNA methyltransferase
MAEPADIKIIVVQPRYQINLGYIARVSKNFGIRQLYLVNPRTVIGERALMFAKHSRELLEHPRIFKGVKEAVASCDIVIGTTGVPSKAGRAANIMTLEQSLKSARAAKRAKHIGILLGRDDIGLTKEELDECDIVAYIPTSPKYPVLNISHALAIMLYALKSNGFRHQQPSLVQSPERTESEYLFRLFAESIENKRIRNKKAVLRIFKKIVRAARPSPQELHALITALK